MLLLISSLLDAESIVSGTLPLNKQMTNVISESQYIVDEFLVFAEQNSLRLAKNIENSA